MAFSKEVVTNILYTANFGFEILEAATIAEEIQELRDLKNSLSGSETQNDHSLGEEIPRNPAVLKAVQAYIDKNRIEARSHLDIAWQILSTSIFECDSANLGTEPYLTVLRDAFKRRCESIVLKTLKNEGYTVTDPGIISDAIEDFLR